MKETEQLKKLMESLDEVRIASEVPQVDRASLDKVMQDAIQMIVHLMPESDDITYDPEGDAQEIMMVWLEEHDE